MCTEPNHLLKSQTTGYRRSIRLFSFSVHLIRFHIYWYGCERSRARRLFMRFELDATSLSRLSHNLVGSVFLFLFSLEFLFEFYVFLFLFHGAAFVFSRFSVNDRNRYMHTHHSKPSILSVQWSLSPVHAHIYARRSLSLSICRSIQYHIRCAAYSFHPCRSCTLSREKVFFDAQ